jgi:periplasmic protein TonB
MPLRCLLFSTDEALVEPVWQVFKDLGIEGEHCKNPVDAVERVTTQLFQIVITDWQDQPEAAFLLKTARDLKASARPLTLAIVNEEARPHALQAGANSILLRPLRAEQVRDTLSTACELLRSKLQTPALTPPRPATETAMAAAAASAPSSLSQAPEKLRAGEFLQTSSSAPSAQFDTESEVPELMTASAEVVDTVSELEPMAASVQDVAEQKPEPQEALTGWAALQARLTKSRPPAPASAATETELLSFEQTSSFEQTPSFHSPVATAETPVQRKANPEAAAEAALFAYMEGESKPKSEPEIVTAPVPNRHGKLIFVGTLALTAAVLAAVPTSRQRLAVLYRSGLRAGIRWLNPPPPSLPQTVTQHDSFGLADDEYKLPATSNIPDATTDPSQIRVVPVVDPTAKPDKNAEANAATASDSQPASVSASQPTASGQVSTTTQSPAVIQNPSAPVAEPQTPAPQNPVAVTQSKDAANSSSTIVPTTTAPITIAPSNQPVAPITVATTTTSQPAPQPPTPSYPSATRSAPSAQQNSASEMAGIPSSLKSQVGSTTPEASGTKPVESALSSIGPVKLSESDLRAQLAQSPDPEYPPAAKASGQGGSVVLQVLVGSDGAVEDAKFLQGSFIFARSAIDAVKQWRFKPYSLNGRAVEVQSVVTINFTPPAS